MYFYYIYINLWIYPNPLIILINLIKNYISKEILIILNHNKTNLIIFISLLFFIIFNNVIGLFNYIFTSSSHLIFRLRLALPLWIRFILYSWINHTKLRLAHLVPLGTPLLLIPLIVLIEIVRALIRPITLSVRLTANIIAGHLLLALIRGACVKLSFRLSFLIVITQISLITLEVAVAFIQSYVFCILVTLYSREV